MSSGTALGTNTTCSTLLSFCSVRTSNRTGYLDMLAARVARSVPTRSGCLTSSTECRLRD